jgi:Tol biopolymer transport system component
MSRSGGTIFGIAQCVCCLAAAPGGAEWLRLSAGQSFSDAFVEAVSPDGRWAVYGQDAETDQAIEIWSVRLPAGLPTRISGLFPADSVIPKFEISPDSSRVVFLSKQDGGGTEIFSVPIGGPSTSGVKLNGTLTAGGNVLAFAISPDASRVVYVADREVNDRPEIYSVPIAGPAGSGVKLNRTLVAGGRVFSVWEISPDSSRVVYVASQDTSGVEELYSVPLAGPATSGVKVSGTLVAGGDVLDLAVSADSARVVYRADQQSDGAFELYGVPLAGPAASVVKLSLGLVAGGGVENDYRISPDSARVVYRADRQTDGVFELYSVPIAGPAGSGFKLNGPLGANGDVQADGFAVSPDSSWVVYAADQAIDEVPAGYRAPLAGPTGSDDQIWYSAYQAIADFEILPGSSTVAVRGSETLVDGIVRLWTYPLAGTPDPAGTDWLGGEIQPNGDCVSFRLLPDGSGALYRADQEADDQIELYLLYFRLWGDGFETGDTSRWSSHLP